MKKAEGPCFLEKDNIENLIGGLRLLHATPPAEIDEDLVILTAWCFSSQSQDPYGTMGLK